MAGCAVLNVGVCSTAQAIFAKLNEFIEKHGFDWMKYKAVAINGTAAMQRTLMKLFEKSKTFPLTVFQPAFLGFFGHRPKFYKMTENS